MRKALLVLALALGAASLSAVTLPGAAGAATRSPTYYVSLGDSYSVGYQPGLGSTPGYTVYTAKHTGMKLVNFGCAGATTTSILNSVGCPVVFPTTVGGVRYPQTTQIAAAQSFLAQHRGHIGLITVIIGGNDVTGCATKPNPISCVGTAVQSITKNVTTLAADLRAAAGTKVPIIGLTYPDVILGAYVFPTHPPSPAAVSLANLSVTAFKVLINPALQKAYAQSSASFVDVTAATGAYTSLKRTVHTAAFGTIPVPVASVCTLTWFCAKGDIHAHTAGYNLIGRLVVARLASLKRT
jgi:lysophospholipase L1-like esterase